MTDDLRDLIVDKLQESCVVIAGAVWMMPAHHRPTLMAKVVELIQIELAMIEQESTGAPRQVH